MTGQPATHLAPNATKKESGASAKIDAPAKADALRLAELSLDAAIEPLYRVARDGSITWANTAACRALQYTRDELVGRPITDIQTLTAPETFDALWLSLIKTGALQADGRHRRKDGSEFSVAVNVQHGNVGGEELALISARELPTGTAELIWDSAGEPLAGQAVSENEARHALGEKIGRFGTWYRDNATNALVYTNGVYDVLGVSKADFPHTRDAFAALIHPDDRDYFEQTIVEWQANNETYEYDHRIVRPDGGIRYVHQRSEPIINKDGQLAARRGIIQDVTERKLTEIRLEQAQQREALVRQQAHIGNWEWSYKDDGAVWDDEAYRIFGYQPGEVTPTYGLAVSHILPEDRDRLHAAEQQGLKPGQSGYEVEYRLIGADGVLRHVQDRGVVTQWHGNDPVYVTGAIQDITESRTAQAELAEVQARFSQARGFAHIGLWEWRPMDGSVDWDDETWRIFGYEPGAHELDDGFVARHVLPEDYLGMRKIELSVIEGQADEYQCEYRIKTASGEIRHLREAAIATRNEAGEVTYLTGSLQNITETTTTAVALKASQQQLQAITDNLPAMVGYIDRERRYRFVNEIYEKAYGVPRAEIIGMHYVELLGEAAVAEMKSKFDRAFEGEAVAFDISRHFRATGDHHMEFQFRPDFDDAGAVRGIYVLGNDITDRKASETALKKSESRLREAQRVARLGEWDRDLVNDTLTVSENIYDIFGITPETFSFSPAALLKLVHPKDRESFQEYSSVRALDTEIFQYDYRVIRPDGGIIHVETRSEPIRNDAGTVIARSGTMQDITEQKRVENEKQEVEARLTEARRRAGMCSWQWDMQSGDVIWSEEAGAVLGLRPNDSLPDRAAYLTMVHPDDQHILLEAEHNAASATGTNEYEYRFMSPDGEMRYLQDVATTTRDADGTVTYSSGTIRDITDEKAAEEKLRQVESRFSLARRHIGIGFWEWTVDSGDVTWSDEAQLIYGFEPGSVQPSHDLFYRHIHPDDLEKFRAAEQEAIKGQKSIYESEYRWITPDGETKHFYGAGVITYDSNGQASIATGIVQDITGRKLAEQKLRDSENRLALAQKQAHIGSTHRIIATNEATWSDEIYEIMGRDPDTYDPSTEDILELFHPDDRQQFSTYFDTATTSEKQYSIDIRIVRPGGEIREVHMQSGPGYDENGIYSFRRGTIQDITERKQAERAVAESERLYHSILDNMVDTFYRTDTEGNVVMASRSAETLLGYTMDDMTGQKLSALYANPEERDDFLNAVHESPTGVRGYEAEMIAKDGRSVWVSTNARYWVDAEGNILGIEGTVRDITEEREVSEQLRQAQKMEAVGQLTGGIAHDFNNMLAVVMGNIELAIDGTDVGSRTNTLLRNTLTRTERGAELVKRLLAFSRKQALAPSVVQLDDIVQSMTNTFGQMLGETIQVATRSVDDLWACEVDRSEIENALLNLIINARDAMPDGGMITVASSNATLDNEGAAAVDMVPGDYSAVTVTDVGTGMTADVLEHVLEPFYTTKGIGEGTGLGLPMVYGFVKQSGGGIRIETAPGEGTAITLYLPRASGPLTTTTSDETRPAEDSSGQTVLVVEDDKEVRTVAVSMISGMGYKFIEAENAAQAMQALGGDERIDILFTDVIMPGKMRGPQLAIEAQKIRPGLKVILTTGYNDIVDFDFQSAGHEFGLLRKPYRRDALAKALSDMLASELS